MKHSSLLFLLFSCLSLVACDDDAEPSPVVLKTDTVHPVVSLTSPAVDDTLSVFGENKILVNIADNMYLRGVRVYAALPECDSSCIPPIMDNELVSINRGNSHTKWNLTIHIPLGAFMGTYKYTVEAEDWQQNVTKESFTFTVHAPDLDLARFSSIIAKNVFRDLDGNDGLLDYDELGAAFYGSLNSDIEDWGIEANEDDWNWFVQFHGLENQTWENWDTNGDDVLQSKEFSSGLEKAGFLAEWDIDNDGLLSEEEFASYLFHRLDHDGNDLLSSNEYLDGFTRNDWF